MPVVPVNPNHPTASAACKWTPSAAVRKLPQRAGKIRANNALVHGASASAPWIATGAGNGAGLANAHAVSVAAFAAAAGSVTVSARSDNSSNSSEGDSDIIGGGCISSGQKSTGMPELSDQQPLEEDYFSAGGDDVLDNNMDDDMPTDAEARKYSFLDRLKHVHYHH